jgi:hypothetical protein
VVSAAAGWLDLPVLAAVAGSVVPLTVVTVATVATISSPGCGPPHQVRSRFVTVGNILRCAAGSAL